MGKKEIVKGDFVTISEQGKEQYIKLPNELSKVKVRSVNLNTGLITVEIKSKFGKIRTDKYAGEYLRKVA